MTLEALKATQEVAQAQGNNFKAATVGFPDGDCKVVILAQANDYAPDASTAIPMVMVGRSAIENDDWRAFSVPQGSLAQAVGLSAADEWKAAATEGKEFRINAKRQAPATPAEFQRGKGKLKFTAI